METNKKDRNESNRKLKGNTHGGSSRPYLDSRLCLAERAHHVLSPTRPWIAKKQSDQYQYLGNCPATPPLT